MGLKKQVRQIEEDHSQLDGRKLFNMGLCYSTGVDDVLLNYIEAHKCFNLASMFGYERAKEYRAELSREMNSEEIAIAQKAAREWIKSLKTA